MSNKHVDGKDNAAGGGEVVGQSHIETQNI